MPWIANQLVSWAINVFANSTNIVGALVIALMATLLWAIIWHGRQRREGKSGVQVWHLLVVGIAGTWLFMTIALGTAAWIAFNGENFGIASSTTQRRDEGPLEWYYNLTMEGGPLSGRNVFALMFRGSNTSQKEVQLKRANIVSALKGSDLSLEIEAEGEIIPIEQAALIPPGAPIVLVAKFGPPDPNAPGKILGLESKYFLEVWRQFYLNVEDDTRKYRLSFNEGHIAAFFPGMAGPHVSKRVQQNAER
jgi:hypothetical protein